MKKYNYHPYQAYHPSYNSHHHHHNDYNHQHQQQQQIPPTPPASLPLLAPPPAPQQRQQPTHPPNYQQQPQQRPQRPQQLTVASFAANIPLATTVANSTATVATTDNTVTAAGAAATTNLSSTQMSSLASAQFLQNQYNLNYSNYNNNNNPQQQQQQQQQHHNHLPFTANNSNNGGNNLQQQHYSNLQQQLHLHQHAQTQLQLQQHQHQSHQQQQRQHATMEAATNTTIHAANNTNNTNTNNNNTGDKFSMDACEIANFLANELFMQQLVSMDGIQTGVPTLTTSTLTPTTLRSIEETFIQLTSDPINAPYQAGFIPPPLAPFPSSLLTTPTASAIPTSAAFQDFNDVNDATDSEDSQGSWQNEAHLNEENSMATTDTSSAATDSTSYQNGLNGMGNTSLATSTSSTNDFTAANIAIASEFAAELARNNKHTSNSATTATPAPTRRNQGGRRPAKSANMSPEEEEKRRIRRERNKLAAARCRKRRVDQTNELQDEVAGLEKKREGLHDQIQLLTAEKESLEFLLQSHRPTCQKIRQDLLSVSTFGGLIAPTTAATTTTTSISNHHHHHNNNNNSNDSNSTITGLDTTLASTAGRSVSPIDLKPNMLDIVQHIKNEPLDTAFDSNSSLEQDDGPPSPKRIMLSKNNPMIPPPLPNVGTLSPALAAAAASASLNTPIMTTAPISFGSFVSNNATLNTLNALHKLPHPNGSKQRPNTLPTLPRSLGQLNVDGKPPTDINGVAIQTPSTGMFNFDSLMDGGTGLTPVSGPLVPTCSSQTNKHPLELQTPTSEPSKLVSL